MQSRPKLYIGLMSGTSLDGVDAVLASITVDQGRTTVAALANSYLPFPSTLHAQLLALQAPGDNELHREAIAANELAALYAQAVANVLHRGGIKATEVSAIGAHGQTVRHRPECGYTHQTGNSALLAELTGIDVVTDFRSRDIAAGGQGAPLVPAYHQAVFGDSYATRVVANIGGIANISVLHTQGDVIGFDTGPGNVLLDIWCAKHLGHPFDMNGAWASNGYVIPELLQALLEEPYLRLSPPKSTGRDLFHTTWLDAKLAAFPAFPEIDVQATLTAFTARSIADAVALHAQDAAGIYVCGGGAYNGHLMKVLAQEFERRGTSIKVETTSALGVPPNQVEALAFAWLAMRHIERMPGNLSSVTGARGARILGALYPA